MPTATANPFCTHFTRPGVIPFYAADHLPADDVFLQAIVDGLSASACGAIVGPHGSGKSTLLESLMPLLTKRFSTISRLQLHGCESTSLLKRLQHAHRLAHQIRTRQNIAAHAIDSLIIIDGYEQLLPWTRWQTRSWVRRYSHSILATSHQEVRGFETLMRTRVTEPLIRALTLDLVQRTSPPLVTTLNAELDSRDLSRLSNVRELWFELYDFVQDSVE